MKNIPKELTEDRAIIEGNFVMTLWKDPSLFYEYSKSIDPRTDLLTKDAKFYYIIGLKMSELGYEEFDEVSVEVFLKDNDKLKQMYDERGGYDEVKEMLSILSPENIDVYYDNLLKSNLLINLDSVGFNVISNLDRFKNATSEQVYDYYDFLLSNTALNKVGHIKSVDLTQDNDMWLEEWDKGVGVGYDIGFPMLNYHTAGLHKGTLLLHIAGIGEGKTSSAILFYVLPTLKAGNSICIIANEQDEEEFRRMLIASVLTNEIGYTKMNRQKLLFGGFSDRDRKHLKKAHQWLEQFKNQLHFVHLTSYDTTDVRRIIKRQSKLGVDLFLFDTLKPEDESSDRSWGEFSQVAKEIFLTAQKENVPVVATAQLKGSSRRKKVLDLDDIGKAKSIAETASQVIMFRRLTAKEKENLFVYTYEKTNNGKYKSKKKRHILDPSKDYIVLFVPKNRFGRAGDLQIVYERNLDFNTMREIGHCNIEPDDNTN